MHQCKTISNNDNEKLFVEIYSPEIIKKTIVFCHGITGCRKGRTPNDSYFQELASTLMSVGYKVILFDYSGHGDSEGNDFDVCLSKSISELETVLKEELPSDKKDIDFLVFSYGAAVLSGFLSNNPTFEPQHIIMFSPCLFPLESCFLNSSSIFGKDIVKAKEDGSLDETGFAVVGAKGFKFGKKMIDDCKDFSPINFARYADKILVLSGKGDVILDTSYNDAFCNEHQIKNIYLEGSHSLFESIQEAFDITMDFLTNN